MPASAAGLARLQVAWLQLGTRPSSHLLSEVAPVHLKAAWRWQCVEGVRPFSSLIILTCISML